MDLVTLAIIVLIVMWLAGWGFAVGGGLVHVLLVIILALVVYRLATGRRPRV